MSNRGENLKSISVTLSPMDLRMAEILAAHYRTTRSEIIRASIRSAYAEFDKPNASPDQLALEFFGSR